MGGWEVVGGLLVHHVEELGAEDARDERLKGHDAKVDEGGRDVGARRRHERVELLLTLEEAGPPAV